MRLHQTIVTNFRKIVVKLQAPLRRVSDYII